MDAERRATLMRDHAAGLYAYAYWLCGDPARARVLVQAAFARARPELTAGLDAPRVRWRLYSALRKAAAAGPPPAKSASGEGPLAEMREALARMAPEVREPLVLQVLGGFAIDAIARLTELPPETVARRIVHARKRIRRLRRVPAAAEGALS